MDYPEANPLVPQLRLDELLAELQVRLQDILDTREWRVSLPQGDRAG